MNTLAGKRIIFVLPTLKLGGSERQALLLAHYLQQEQKADIQVWGFSHPERVAEICEASGIPWRIVPTKWSKNRQMRLKGLLRFAWILRQARPDIVLPYTMTANVICGLVWRWSGAKLCVWNQRDEGFSEQIGRFFQRLATRQIPSFIANSQVGATFLIETLQVEPQKVQVIQNGVEMSAPGMDRLAWRQQLNVSKTCFLACMVANLHALKDHVTLLKAWRKVVDNLIGIDKEAVLLLAGRLDNNYELLQRLTQDLQLSAHVRFLGKVDDITGLLQAVDLGVHSSLSEGCPNGVLECMAAALPVVGTDIAGIREAIGDHGVRYLAAPGNDNDLAKKMFQFATDTSLCKRVGIENRKRIEQQFQPKLMYQKSITHINYSLRESRSAFPSPYSKGNLNKDENFMV